MTYLAYLDEFRHVGPYASKADPKYRESPLFGPARFVLPTEEVRGFGTWFFQRKCQLLGWGKLVVSFFVESPKKYTQYKCAHGQA